MQERTTITLDCMSCIGGPLHGQLWGVDAIRETMVPHIDEYAIEALVFLDYGSLGKDQDCILTVYYLLWDGITPNDAMRIFFSDMTLRNTEKVET